MEKSHENFRTRRVLLQGAAAALGTSAFAQTPRRAVYAYVGSFTSAVRRARGDGIHAYRITPAGVWTHIQHVGGLVNPSFLVLSRDQRFLYSVHADESYATAFRVDKETGELTRLNEAKTGGPNGVHQAIDPSGRFMLVANYANGTIAVLPVRDDGSLGDYIQLLTLGGSARPAPRRADQLASASGRVRFVRPIRDHPRQGARSRLGLALRPGVRTREFE